MVTAKEEIKAEEWKVEPKLGEKYQYQTKEDYRRRHKEEDNLKPL